MEILGGGGTFFENKSWERKVGGEQGSSEGYKKYLHIIWYGERKGDRRLGWEWERDMIRNISSNGSMYLYYLVFYDIMHCIGL